MIYLAGHATDFFFCFTMRPNNRIKLRVARKEEKKRHVREKRAKVKTRGEHLFTFIVPLSVCMYVSASVYECVSVCLCVSVCVFIIKSPFTEKNSRKISLSVLSVRSLTWLHSVSVLPNNFFFGGPNHFSLPLFSKRKTPSLHLCVCYAVMTQSLARRLPPTLSLTIYTCSYLSPSWVLRFWIRGDRERETFSA